MTYTPLKWGVKVILCIAMISIYNSFFEGGANNPEMLDVEAQRIVHLVVT